MVHVWCLGSVRRVALWTRHLQSVEIIRDWFLARQLLIRCGQRLYPCGLYARGHLRILDGHLVVGLIGLLDDRHGTIEVIHELSFVFLGIAPSSTILLILNEIGHVAISELRDVKRRAIFRGNGIGAHLLLALAREERISARGLRRATATVAGGAPLDDINFVIRAVRVVQLVIQISLNLRATSRGILRQLLLRLLANDNRVDLVLRRRIAGTGGHVVLGFPIDAFLETALDGAPFALRRAKLGACMALSLRLLRTVGLVIKLFCAVVIGNSVLLDVY